MKTWEQKEAETREGHRRSYQREIARIKAEFELEPDEFRTADEKATRIFYDRFKIAPYWA